MVFKLVSGMLADVSDDFAIGELVRGTRMAMGMTQANFAEIIGCNGQSVVSRVESGKILLSNSCFLKLLGLYEYDSYRAVVAKFGRPVSVKMSLESSLLLPDVHLITSLLDAVQNYEMVSYRKLAEILGISYCTILKLSKGFISAGAYTDISTILRCWESDGFEVYKMVQAY